MRALVTIQPGTGHLRTVMPVVGALSDAGHQVAICSAPSFRPEVESQGLAHIDGGVDWLVSAPSPPFPLTDLPLGPERTAWMFANVFAGVLARKMATDLLDVAATWRPDIIVRETTELGGCVAAEGLGIPHASVVAGARSSFVFARRTQMMGKPLDRLRHQFGLPSDPGTLMPYRYLHLSFLPRRFEGPDSQWPPTAHFLRHTNRPRPGETLPGWVAELPSQPTVLAALGTVAHRTPGLAVAILEGLRDEPLNLIVAVGRDEDPERFGMHPPNVRVERYVPQTLLLPFCSVFVNHAGFNSLKEALSFGVPMVVIPTTGDTPYGAACCDALGVAKVVPPDQRGADAIRRATLAVLREPGYRAEAERFQDEMLSLPGQESVVELLERLVAERAPVLGDDGR